MTNKEKLKIANQLLSDVYDYYYGLGKYNFDSEKDSQQAHQKAFDAWYDLMSHIGLHLGKK